MGGRDHSCEGCGNGGFANDLPCTCAPVEDELWLLRQKVQRYSIIVGCFVKLSDRETCNAAMELARATIGDAP